MKIEDLQQRLLEINDEAQALQAKVEAEKRDLTEDERRQLDSLLAEFDVVKADIEREERLAAQTAVLTQGRGRRTSPNQPGAAGQSDGDDGDDDSGDADLPAAKGRNRQLAPAPRVPAEPVRSRGNWGWRNLGDFALGVRRACVNGGSLDPRLERQLAAASTFGREDSGADGGFAVPPDFKTEIMKKVMGEDTLLSRCDQMTSGTNNFSFPKDEATPWQTSGGVLAYWEGEAAAHTQSKPAVEQGSVRLNKITALVPMTDELLDDAPAMDSWLRKKAPEKINFKISLAIVQGTGVGQPLGILNAPATVSVAKESSQAADTIVGANVLKMWARMYAPCRARAIWLANQDIEPQLFQLTLPGRDNTGAVVTGWGSHVYLPPNGLVNAPFGTLLGRPVIPTQACETLGDKGDLIFADLSQYMALTKPGGLRTETSMHLWFDQDITAFKFVMRVGGYPWWGSSISPRDGSNTLSCFVTLDERA